MAIYKQQKDNRCIGIILELGRVKIHNKYSWAFVLWLKFWFFGIDIYL